MGYRDEKESLRARVDELEGELAEAREKIARLTGESSMSSDPTAEHSRVLAGPLSVARDETLDFEVDDAGYEAIAALLRERLQMQVTQVGRTLNFDAPGRPSFALTTEDGTTRIRMTESYRHRRAGILAGGAMLTLLVGILGGGLLGGLGVPPVHVIWLLPVLASLAVVPWRAHLTKVVGEDRKKLSGTFEAVLALARAHAIDRKPARVRARVPRHVAASENARSEDALHDDPGFEEVEHELAVDPDRRTTR